MFWESVVGAIGRSWRWVLLCAAMLGMAVTAVSAAPPAAPPATRWGIRDLVVLADGAMVATDYDGLYRSSGFGKPWIKVLDRGSGRLFNAGADGLYADTWGGQKEVALYHSADAGQTWQRRGEWHQVQARLPDGTLLGCAADALGPLMPGQKRALEYSRDGGRSWHVWPMDLPGDMQCVSVQVKAGIWLVRVRERPRRFDEAVVSAGGRGPWRRVSDSRPSDPLFKLLIAKALDDQGRVYATWVRPVRVLADGTRDFSDDHGDINYTAYSDDGGQSWRKFETSFPQSHDLFYVIDAWGGRVFFAAGRRRNVPLEGTFWYQQGKQGFPMPRAEHGTEPGDEEWKAGGDGHLYVRSAGHLDQFRFDGSQRFWRSIPLTGLPDSRGKPRP